MNSRQRIISSEMVPADAIAVKKCFLSLGTVKKETATLCPEFCGLYEFFITISVSKIYNRRKDSKSRHLPNHSLIRKYFKLSHFLLLLKQILFNIVMSIQHGVKNPLNITIQ